MWNILLYSLSGMIVGLFFILISLWFIFRVKGADRISSVLLLILGCAIVFIFPFNLNETREAIKKYNFLRNKDEINNITNITIVPYIGEPEIAIGKTIKKQIVIKNKSKIYILLKELNKIKSTNEKVSLTKSVKLNIKPNNNDLIILSVCKVDERSDISGCLIELFVNNKVYGSYKSDEIWELLFNITENKYFN